MIAFRLFVSVYRMRSMHFYQVLIIIKCGRACLLSKSNTRIILLPSCLCDELKDGKQEINLEWPLCKTSFQSRIDLKRRMQGSDVTTQEEYLLYICCVLLQMSGSLLAFFHHCLVYILFSGPSLTEIKFYTNVVPSIIVHGS